MLLYSGVGVMKPKDNRATEMEDDNDDDLIDCLSQYLLNHVNGEKRVRLLVGLAIEQDWGGRVQSKCKSGKGIHDDVDPKQLNSTQQRHCNTALRRGAVAKHGVEEGWLIAPDGLANAVECNVARFREVLQQEESG